MHTLKTLFNMADPKFLLHRRHKESFTTQQLLRIHLNTAPLRILLNTANPHILLNAAAPKILLNTEAIRINLTMQPF